MSRKRGEHISPKSCSEIIVSLWREFGGPAVGASELTRLQDALAEIFGRDKVPSPARIARDLAQEGAALRPPEIIEISEWFRVWLETPNLFNQWLELRRSSEAFKEKFSDFD